MTATTASASAHRSRGVPDGAHVLHAVPPAAPAAGDLRLLSPDERHRADRIRVPAAAARHVTSRALLRRLLADLLGVSPRQVALVVAPSGKVAVADGDGLRVNISHTDGMVVVVVAATAVGVDVERVDRHPLPPLTAWLSPAELERLAAHGSDEGAHDSGPDLDHVGHDRHRDLVRTWTAKEAVAKAHGCHPALALADIEVDGDTARVPDRTGGTPWATWDLHDLPITPTHVATLATSRLGGAEWASIRAYAGTDTPSRHRMTTPAHTRPIRPPGTGAGAS